MDNHAAGSSSSGSGDGGALRRNSRKPKYSKFTQQELPACKPILTPKWVISVFVLVGAIFVPIGVASLLASRKVVEIVDRYDDACIPPNMTDKLAYIQNKTISKICTRTLKVPEDMTPPIFVYYQLDNFFQNHRSLDLDGVAAITQNGLLELTDGGFQVKGHAFQPAPLRLANASFSTAFVFAIVSRYDLVSDNDLAFVVSPTKNLSSSNAGQYLGLLNISDNGDASNHIFAVEVDTILNPEFHDIDSNHIGIDVDSLKSVQSYMAGSEGAALLLWTAGSEGARQRWAAAARGG